MAKLIATEPATDLGPPPRIVVSAEALAAARRAIEANQMWVAVPSARAVRC
jgi:hypothetical protein